MYPPGFRVKLRGGKSAGKPPRRKPRPRQGAETDMVRPKMTATHGHSHKDHTMPTGTHGNVPTAASAAFRVPNRGCGC